MVPYGKDFFGRPNMVENTVDESTMRKIAQIGSGEFFGWLTTKPCKPYSGRLISMKSRDQRDTFQGYYRLLFYLPALGHRATRHLAFAEVNLRQQRIAGLRKRQAGGTNNNLHPNQTG